MGHQDVADGGGGHILVLPVIGASGNDRGDVGRADGLDHLGRNGNDVDLHGRR
ncbi:hypothetical protein D3C72_2153270 [compost metagenome]